MTVMTNIMTVVMTNMIEWRMMITNMSVQHQSRVKGREQEMWSMSIDDQRGHFLGNMSTKAVGTSQLVLLLVRNRVMFCRDIPFLVMLIIAPNSPVLQRERLF